MSNVDYMARALELAARAKGTTGNNPAVGAVIVRGGRIVGEGYTQPPGQAHAEIMALAQAGEQARGATLYVTLEPCSHYGRTPPCVNALLAAGIAEVHMAMLDPNPLVSGAGKAALERAGVSTVVGEHEADARRLMEAWLTYITKRRPMVVAKYAMSLDGKIATRTGDSRWITGEAARLKAHQLRSEMDAIMVGVNTVLADDPQLTARGTGGELLSRQPVRVVVDSTARIPTSSRVIAGALPGPTVVIVTDRAHPEKLRAIERLGHRVIVAADKDGRVDLRSALEILALELGITSLLVEGGGTLLGSLLDLRLVDKVVVFLAPKLVGGAGAPGPFGGQGVAAIDAAVQVCDVSWEQLGDDLMVVGYVKQDVHGDS